MKEKRKKYKYLSWAILGI